MMPKTQENSRKKKGAFFLLQDELGMACMDKERGHRVARMMHKVKLYLALKSKLEIWRLEVCV